MRLLGEDIDAEDELKTRLYPYADRAIAYLDDDQPDHTRAHLVNSTVMLVAAAANFSSTLDRPRGAELLRRLAILLEAKRLGDVPWGPGNKAHKPILRRLVDEHLGPQIDTNDEHDGMLSLMHALEAEFTTAVDRLVSRFEFRAAGADERLLHGFLVQFLLRRYAEVDPSDAWSTVRNVAIDEGWIEPDPATPNA